MERGEPPDHHDLHDLAGSASTGAVNYDRSGAALAASGGDLSPATMAAAAASGMKSS